MRFSILMGFIPARDYNKLGGLKKELSNTGMQVCMMNQFSACQNKAMMALVKLQSHGITEDEILNRCKLSTT